jgi:hypothetical protein
MAYVNLSESYIEKNRKKAKEEAISNFGDEDGKDNLVFVDTEKDRAENDALDHIEEIDEDGSITITSESKLGYISIDIQLTDEDFITLIGIAVKRLNKFKNVLESLK